MLTDIRVRRLDTLVNLILDRAEEEWKGTMVKTALLEKSLSEMAESNIPGHSFLGPNNYVSDNFIAMMVDMRDSTEHLRRAISGRTARASQMERVFYEISALLPAVARIVKDEKGAVTEYLGDGALALFQATKDPAKWPEAIYSSHGASENCIDALHKVINPTLAKRYGLPPIEIGVGLAFSEAVVTRFGLPPNTEVKVIGECVYFASELSKGRNEIIVDGVLERAWPTSDSGRIRFRTKKYGRKNDIDGYILGYKDQSQAA